MKLRASPLYRRLASMLLGRPSNFSWFRPGIAASGMPHGRKAFEWLRAQGISAILNLSERPYEVQGIKVYHVPMEDMMPASPEKLALAVNIINGCIRSGRKILVHCMAGKGRTGMVLASYLVAYEDLKAYEAIEEVRRLRPGSVELREQEESVKEFENYISKDVYSIVLAAGMSTRFGKNKLLYPIQGKPMIRRVVEETIKAGIKVVVVLGHEKERIKQALDYLDVKFVENPNYEEGMSTSVKAGLKAVMDEAKAVMFLPGDVAFIQARQIRAVYDAYKKGGGLIVIPTYRGRGGHPILFDRSIFEEIMGITEEGRGLKSVVQAHRGKIKMVELGTARILVDIDTEMDLKERVREIQEAS